MVTRSDATTKDASYEPRFNYCRFSNAGCNRYKAFRRNRLRIDYAHRVGVIRPKLSAGPDLEGRTMGLSVECENRKLTVYA